MREFVQPMIEVAAELLRAHQAEQFLVAGGQHAGVDRDRLHPADAPDLLFLQRAQQLRLDIQRQVRDFVEEQRAAGGDLELAQLGPLGARERALLIARKAPTR